ncbi:hypothetical protein CBS101457_003149 [Exobasidium rhododendri]|nr:hypothetical protein CBS101457_003149 [Exobasidium rhododendri]
MSLPRTIRHIRQAGWKKFWHDLNYIGDAKAGTLMGTDSLGNKYYEDFDEIPGRNRWVDFAAHDFSAPQVEPVWHSWLNHIRQDPPNADPVVQASKPTWQADHRDSVTGTRGAFKTYSTVRPKINTWEPKVASRS